MRMSRYFLPTLKEVPTEAKAPSHRLMLRAGMIAQECAGLYYWLPLGLKVLKKVEQIVREELDKAGFHELLIPTLQPAELWEESGRYEAYGKEMLRIKDRHDRDLLYGPTAEEAVTDIFRRFIKSYKNLPQVLYQIQWKFRDEIRPRFGVMRGREFYMKDAYSFDLDKESAKKTYKRVMETYLKIFARLGLQAIPVQADTGPIGGDLSHEFHVLADTGESDIYYDKKLHDLDKNTVAPDLEQIMNIYARADDMHDPATCAVPDSDLLHKKGIEVGHIFYYGTKYADSMGVMVTNQEGKQTPFEGGCYGIGISRLVAALIEANHDDYGIKWPKAVAPFDIGLLNLKKGHEESDHTCDSLYHTLQEKGFSILYDDRDAGVGAKFSDMDLVGLPLQIAVGPRGLKEGQVELKVRATGTRENILLEDLYARIGDYA